MSLTNSVQSSPSMDPICHIQYKLPLSYPLNICRDSVNEPFSQSKGNRSQFKEFFTRHNQKAYTKTHSRSHSENHKQLVPSLDLSIIQTGYVRHNYFVY